MPKKYDPKRITKPTAASAFTPALNNILNRPAKPGKFAAIRMKPAPKKAGYKIPKTPKSSGKGWGH